MPKSHVDSDSETDVTTRDHVTPVITTVSYTSTSTTTIGCMAPGAGYDASTWLPQRKVRTPITDPNVGWIYDMNKGALVAEMIKYKLDTTGTVETLRRRFSEYWRLTSAQMKIPGFAQKSLERPHTLAVSEAAGGLPMGTGHLNSFLDLSDELASVREILGLSPNADTYTVRHVLTSLVRPSVTVGGGYQATSNLEDFELPRDRSTRVTYSQGPPRVSSVVETRAVPTQASIPVSGFEEVSSVPGPSHRMTSIQDPRGTRDRASVCQAVRKWNLKFDGKRDPVSFLERLDEMTDAYAVPKDDVVKALPELLTGPALLWYRNSRASLIDYATFREYFELQFLPPGYHRNLDEEVRARTQGDHEPFREFVIAITTLMRRSGSLSQESQIDIIYKNMRPEYKIMVRRQDCSTLTNLISAAEDYEAYVRDKANFRPPPPPTLALVSETAYVNKSKSRGANDSAAAETRADYRRESTIATRMVGGRASDTEDTRKLSSTRAWPRSRPSGRGSSRQQTGQVTCWNCQEDGHFSRDCRRPRRNERLADQWNPRATREASGNGNPVRDERGHPGPGRISSERPLPSGKTG